MQDILTHDHQHRVSVRAIAKRIAHTLESATSIQGRWHAFAEESTVCQATQRSMMQPLLFDAKSWLAFTQPKRPAILVQNPSRP